VYRNIVSIIQRPSPFSVRLRRSAFSVQRSPSGAVFNVQLQAFSVLRLCFSGFKKWQSTDFADNPDADAKRWTL